MRTLKSGLDKLSQEALAAADRFFGRHSPEQQPSGGFTVWEQELNVSGGVSSSKLGKHQIVCPNARLDERPSHGNTIMFTCCCSGPGETHAGRLQYRPRGCPSSIPRWPLLTRLRPVKSSRAYEVVRPGTERTWRVVWRNQSTNNVVSVKITGVLPQCKLFHRSRIWILSSLVTEPASDITEVQDWIKNLAVRWAIKHKLKKDLNNVRPPYAYFTPSSLFLLVALW